jgi:4-amino-4-deoxy-L-arabinose transferase-like glycosyltransferase
MNVQLKMVTLRDKNLRPMATTLLKITDFVIKNKVEIIILGLILLVGSFFRLYKISEYMTFLGDEGRDVIIVRNLLVHADPILIGPGTSIGGMYLGPLYYYLIAIPLLLANFSPVGPAIFVAILGVVTICFVWYVFREWFPNVQGDTLNVGALVAAGLYAISPTVIIFSRASWNPNIMPFFALLSIYSIWKAYMGNGFKWLIVCAISFAFVLQSHYLGLLLLPTVGIFWILSLLEARKKSQEMKRFVKLSLIAILSFALLMSPLLIFDLRHNFMNYNALYKFLTVRQETVSIRPWTSFSKIPAIFSDINSSLLVAKNSTLAEWITLLLVVMTAFFVFLKRKLNSNVYILISWIIFGLIGLGLYKQHIYDHYYGFLFPAVFLLVGFLISKMNKYLAVFFVCVFLFINLQKNPLLFNPNKQMQRSIDVANLVLEKSDDKPFNLAVLAERNYEDGYRYFMEKDGAVVMHADRWDGKTIVDQLFVICEMEKTKCDPTHSPKAEVANFGMSKIDMEWEVDGVIIYRLIHSR